MESRLEPVVYLHVFASYNPGWCGASNYEHHPIMLVQVLDTRSFRSTEKPKLRTSSIRQLERVCFLVRRERLTL